MWAERLGSYSIDATFGRHAVLAPLEVDLAVQALGAAAAVARRLAPVVLRPPDFLQALDERLLGLFFVTSAKSA
jgi:hypothetical protein